MEMTEFIFKNNYVENEGKFYRMDGGLMTGSHSAVIIGDIILNNAYLKAIDNNNTEPRGLTLFVDDSWGVWTHGKPAFDKFMEYLNRIWPGLKFIPMMEDDNRTIIFLDLKLSINASLRLKYEHYVKPTSSRRYLHYNSHNPISMKTNIIKMETKRIIRNCSDLNDIYPHIDNLKNAFINSGYPSIFIDNIILPIIQRAESK